MSEVRLRLLVLDWAGTAVDHGCFAPVAPFIEALRAAGVEISDAEARRPMGLEKRDHIRALLGDPDIASRWRAANGSAPTEADVERVFATFVPLQLESVEIHSGLIDGLLDSVDWLRARGIRIGTTTGYLAEAAERCYAAAARQGYRPDMNVHPAQVPKGRPAPWMIFRIMEALDVYPPAAVLKLGDTLPDIAEGLAAGCWSAGVTHTGSEVGLGASELAALPAADRASRVEQAGRRLLDAGAHAVIDSVRDLPALVEEIDGRLARGHTPSSVAPVA